MQEGIATPILLGNDKRIQLAIVALDIIGDGGVMCRYGERIARNEYAVDFDVQCCSLGKVGPTVS